MSDTLLIRIVASRGERDGMLGDELVANLRIAPAVIAGAEGKDAFLGLLLDGAGELFDAMQKKDWLP